MRILEPGCRGPCGDGGAEGEEESLLACLLMGRGSPLPAGLRLPLETLRSTKGCSDLSPVPAPSLKMDCPLAREQGHAALAAPGGAGDVGACDRAGSCLRI